MKTVCKKLLCLMLVAMMLISAVPFAFAAGEVTVKVSVTKDGSVIADNKKIDLAEGESVTLTKDLAMSKINKPAGMEFESWTNSNGEIVTGNALPYEWVKDQVDYSLTINMISVACPHTNKTTVNTVKCDADGVETVTCNDCGEILSNKEVKALGHNFVGPECTKCDATRNPIDTITFHYMTSADVWTAKTINVYEDAEEITPPAEADNVRGFYFQGWSSVKNGAAEVPVGYEIVWSSTTSDDYWAVYDDDKDDGLVHLTVKVAYYVNGSLNKTETLLTSDDFVKDEDNNQMYRWLYGDGFKAINKALFANGNNADYKWNEVFYLNNKGTDKVNSDEKLMDDGNKIVYVVLNSKDYIEANVQLYVHKSQSKTVYDIIDMNGYTAGDKVTRADVIDVLEDEDYSYSSLSYLYSQTEWENLLNGDNADGDKDITVTHNGTTKIHVIAKNAKTSSSKADTSNPKTGDSIMVAVATMTLAAAAAVTMVELKKRKMI